MFLTNYRFKQYAKHSPEFLFKLNEIERSDQNKTYDQETGKRMSTHDWLESKSDNVHMKCIVFAQYGIIRSGQKGSFCNGIVKRSIARKPGTKY